MSDAYVECLVKAKTSPVIAFFKYVLYFMTAAMGILTLLFANVMFLILAVVSFVGAYLINMMADVEYEYMYLDRELTVDKIMAKTRRKKVAVYQLDRMEIVAPYHSYHLDNYKNRQAKVRDFSIGYEDKPDRRYVIYYEGGEKLILSPNEEMIKLLRNAAPRKVFTD